MNRREVIAGLGSAAMSSAAVRAQQRTMPVVAWLGIAPADDSKVTIAALHRGLAETGFIVRQNVGFEPVSSDHHLDLLPMLAEDLIRRRVAVLFCPNLVTTLAAKSTTQDVPIVFVMGADPVQRGIITSLARPGGNITGVTVLGNLLAAKRLETLHQVVPSASLIAYLVNRSNPVGEIEMQETRAAAALLGVRLLIVDAGLTSEIEAAFAEVVRSGAGALLLSGDPLFLFKRDNIIALAARYQIPTAYAYREAAVSGGLISYDTPLADAFRIGGVYVGRILKGEKPADLPVQQSTRIELVINLKTANALGLTIPETLLATADEVIQ
jgi:putative tryptophan/tyrosine transport system substrate-binding protein